MLEQQVARLPARLELRVEPQEALDLEPAVRDAQDGREQRARRRSPVPAASDRSAEKFNENSSMPASPSSRAASTTMNSVMPLGVSRSRRMNPSDTTRRPVDRHEVQEPADPAVAVARDQHARIGHELVDERVVGHAEAALRCAVAPALAHALELVAGAPA